MSFDSGSSEIWNLLKILYLSYPQILYWKLEICCWS